jgi:hypothetical protein
MCLIDDCQLPGPEDVSMPREGLDGPKNDVFVCLLSAKPRPVNPSINIRAKPFESSKVLLDKFLLPAYYKTSIPYCYKTFANVCNDD